MEFFFGGWATPLGPTSSELIELIFKKNGTNPFLFGFLGFFGGFCRSVDVEVVDTHTHTEVRTRAGTAQQQKKSEEKKFFFKLNLNNAIFDFFDEVDVCSPPRAARD